jgi:hypothetical protein
MFDPALDSPDEEWCYAAQSTTVIGIPFVPEPVQVTYDGAIYTRHAELAFFYGKDFAPVMARHKTFLDGWMPVVEYGWKVECIDYHLEIFSALLPELGIENLVQFARLTMSNTGNEPAEASVAAATRGTGALFRLGNLHEPIKAGTRFKMEDDSFMRDDRLVYSFSPEALRYVVPDVTYQRPYIASKENITKSTATGFTLYHRKLQPGETYAATFKMPRVPLDQKEQIEAVKKADYQKMLEKTVQYWQELLGGMGFDIPEKRVNDSYRAALVHLILATRTQDDMKRQGSGLPYDDLFLNDYFDMLLAYDTAGLYQFTEPNVDWLLKKQHPSGMFIDVHNRGNDTFVTSHGQGLYSLAYHFLMTRNRAYGDTVYPAIRKAADFIVRDHQSDKYGLIRPSIPYDAPMVTGYHTCHNLYALLALRTSIRVARILGQNEDIDRWTQAEKSYREAIVKALDTTYKKEGFITSGLYDWKPGFVQGRKEMGVNEFPNQDWENNLLVYPSELLLPNDERVVKTLATIRARKYREGCMTYRNGMHIHQYVTLNQANQYRAIGDQRHALLDLYHVLLHNGSTHEGFENLVIPWSNRTPEAGCPPPHAWAAAKTALFIRNMMVCEYGGDAGIDLTQRDLYLYSLVSPVWMVPGKQLTIRNAPTEMGVVSSTLSFTVDGAELTVTPNFVEPPRFIAFRIPYTVELDSFTSNASRTSEKDGLLFFTPDMTTASIHWHQNPGANDNNYQDLLMSYRSEFNDVIKDGNYDLARAGKPFLLEDEKNYPAEPLSFELIRKAFSKEYRRRYEEFVRAGGKPYQVLPPERR